MSAERVDRRIDELRDWIDVQKRFMRRLVKFRLRLAGHLVRMAGQSMAKKVDRLRRRGWRTKR